MAEEVSSSPEVYFRIKKPFKKYLNAGVEQPTPDVEKGAAVTKNNSKWDWGNESFIYFYSYFKFLRFLRPPCPPPHCADRHPGDDIFVVPVRRGGPLNRMMPGIRILFVGWHFPILPKNFFQFSFNMLNHF